jgi:hypothetical protein
MINNSWRINEGANKNWDKKVKYFEKLQESMNNSKKGMG